MTSIALRSRRAGLLYIVLGALGVLTLIYFPSAFNVHGDPAATVQRITQRAGMYRLFVFTDLLGAIWFILIALALYDLFKDVDRKLSAILVILVSISSAIAVASLLSGCATSASH